MRGGAALLTTHGAYTAPRGARRALLGAGVDDAPARTAHARSARCCARDLRLLWRRRGDALQPAAVRADGRDAVPARAGPDASRSRRSRAACRGSRCCWRACCRWTRCSAATPRTARSNSWSRAAAAGAAGRGAAAHALADTGLPLLLVGAAARRTAAPAAGRAAGAAGLAGAGHAAAVPARRGGGRADGRHAALWYPLSLLALPLTCRCWCSARARSPPR